MNSGVDEAFPRKPLFDEHVERFKRIYGAERVAVSVEADAVLRDTIATGNYARVLLAEDGPTATQEYLETIVRDSDEAIEMVMRTANPDLVDRVQAAWSNVPADENKKSSGLLNTLCESREIFRSALQEIDGSEKSGSTISGVLDTTVSRVDEWLRTQGTYVMRPRRIKAKILTEQEVTNVYATLETLQEGSHEWLHERAKLMESVYRLCKHIAVNRFLLPGRLPNMVSVDELANEAAEYSVLRIKNFGVSNGIKLSSWVAKFLDHFYARRISELANPIHIPVNQLGPLMSADPAQRIGMAGVINECSRGITPTHNAWIALGQNILRLDGDDGPTDSDRFVTDPEGPEQNITWQELLTDYHRVGSSMGTFHSDGLWPGHGCPDVMTMPSDFAEQRDEASALQRAMDELLDERSAEILGLRYGLIDGQFRTLEETGEPFGITRERVRQIETKAIARLLNAFTVNQDSVYYRQFAVASEDLQTHLERYDPHKGQPVFPEYEVGEAASAQVLEGITKARRQRSGAVDPSLWEW